MHWNWDNFRYFLALADRQTLIAAATELGVSHTTVLRRIKAFESQIGTQLFTHSPEGYRLTEKGLALRAQVNTLKESVDSIARTVAGSDNEIGGKIKITTPDTIGYELMPSILSGLTTKYPALQVELLIQNRLTDLTRLEAEIAIRGGSNPPENLIGKKLGRLRFCTCASTAYLKINPMKSFPSDLDQHRLIVLTSNFHNANFQKWLMQQLPANQPTIVVDGLMSAFNLCCAGVGIAVLPRYLLRNEPSLVSIECSNPIPDNELWVLSHKDLRNSATVKAVKQYIGNELKSVFN